MDLPQRKTLAEALQELKEEGFDPAEQRELELDGVKVSSFQVREHINLGAVISPNARGKRKRLQNISGALLHLCVIQHALYNITQ